MKYRLVRTADCPPGLFRVVATASFGEVANGEIGGFVASVRNLAQEGNCWIHDDACARDDAVVSDDAQVYGDAQVFGRALVGGTSVVSDGAWVFDDAVLEDSVVAGYAWVSDNASVLHARIERGATVSGSARVSNCTITGFAQVGGQACMDHGLITVGDTEIAWRDMLEVVLVGRRWGLAGQSRVTGNSRFPLVPDLGSWFGESPTRTCMPKTLHAQEMLDDERGFFRRMELFLAEPV